MKLTRTQFVVFSIIALLWSTGLGFFAYYEIKTPVSFFNAVFGHHSSSDKKDTTILVFGDMMLDRLVRQKINENGTGYPFSLIHELLSGNDIVFANAEGSFTNFNSITIGKLSAPLEFTFDPKMLPILKNLGFTLLGQTNNHSLDFGENGFTESLAAIKAAGIDYVGDPTNKNIVPYVKEINGEKIAFIGYSEFAYQGLDNVLAAIRQAKKEFSYIIVYGHWGTEYNFGFTVSQQKAARAFIDAGADMVFASHPHVIEPLEIYKNKPIFYSLGNFIFDQSSSGPTSDGLAVRVRLNTNAVQYEIIPIFIKYERASLMDTVSRKETLIDLAKNAIAPETMKENIAEGIFSLQRN